MTMEYPVTVAPNVPNFVLCDKVNMEPDVRFSLLIERVFCFGFPEAVKERAKCLKFI